MTLLDLTAFPEGTPLVQRIQRGLRQRIARDELPVGTRLPSMRALAADLGVSVGIVKQALNQLTAEGVLEAQAREGLFVAEPRAARRELALILPDIEQENLRLLARGAREAVRAAGHRLVIHAADFDYADQLRLIDRLDPRFHAGALVVPPPMEGAAEAIASLVRRGVPCIEVLDLLPVPGVDAVVPDGFAMGRLAAAHLLAHGHRRIGIVDWSADTGLPAAIRRGAALACAEAGLAFDALPRAVTDHRALDPEHPAAAGQAAAAALLADHPQLTALLGLNANLALGCILAARAAALPVPDRLSLVAVGQDLPAFALLEPAITVVTAPYRDCGQRAALRLLDRLAGGAPDGLAVALPPILVERASVAAPG